MMYTIKDANAVYTAGSFGEAVDTIRDWYQDYAQWATGTATHEEIKLSVMQSIPLTNLNSETTFKCTQTKFVKRSQKRAMAKTFLVTVTTQFPLRTKWG